MTGQTPEETPSATYTRWAALPPFSVDGEGSARLWADLFDEEREFWRSLDAAQAQAAPGTVPAAGLDALAARWEAEAAEACELPDGEFTRARRSQALAFADCARALRSLVARTGNGGAQ